MNSVNHNRLMISHVLGRLYLKWRIEHFFSGVRAELNYFVEWEAEGGMGGPTRGRLSLNFKKSVQGRAPDRPLPPTTTITTGCANAVYWNTHLSGMRQPLSKIPCRNLESPSFWLHELRESGVVNEVQVDRRWHSKWELLSLSLREPHNTSTTIRTNTWGEIPPHTLGRPDIFPPTLRYNPDNLIGGWDLIRHQSFPSGHHWQWTSCKECGLPAVWRGSDGCRRYGPSMWRRHLHLLFSSTQHRQAAVPCHRRDPVSAGCRQRAAQARPQKGL